MRTSDDIRREMDDIPPFPPNGKANGHHAEDMSVLSMTPAAWLKRQIPPEDLLLGRVISTSSRGLLAAETGKGKTMLCLAIAFAVRLGHAFMHWRGHGKERRVLFIDGEMPRDLMQERIGAACSWFGVDPPEDGLFLLSREDFEDMPPLDTQEGQDWLDSYINAARPDLIILDNLMSLTVGNLKETDSWRMIEPWLKSLTRRRIGLLLVHHLGHDRTKVYGDATKEWTVDYVILGEGVDDPNADVCLKLEFKKARRRRPDSADDFATGKARLEAGEWTWTPTDMSRKSGGKLTDKAQIALKALRTALASAGEKPPYHSMTAGVDTAVLMSTWRRYFTQEAGYADDPKGRDAERKAFDRGKEQLKALGVVGIWGDWAWTDSKVRTSGRTDTPLGACPVRPSQNGTDMSDMSGNVQECPARPGDQATSFEAPAKSKKRRTSVDEEKELPPDVAKSLDRQVPTCRPKLGFLPDEPLITEEIEARFSLLVRDLGFEPQEVIDRRHFARRPGQLQRVSTPEEMEADDLGYARMVLIRHARPAATVPS